MKRVMIHKGNEWPCIMVNQVRFRGRALR